MKTLIFFCFFFLSVLFVGYQLGSDDRYYSPFIQQQKKDAIENYKLCRDVFHDPDVTCVKSAVESWIEPQ